jgi:hypothetical protein
MLNSLLLKLLISNALTLRKDKSILFSRMVRIASNLTTVLAFKGILLTWLKKAILIYCYLFHVTVFTQAFNIIILYVKTRFSIYKNKLLKILVCSQKASTVIISDLFIGIIPHAYLELNSISFNNTTFMLFLFASTLLCIGALIGFVSIIVFNKFLDGKLAISYIYGTICTPSIKLVLSKIRVLFDTVLSAVKYFMYNLSYKYISKLFLKSIIFRCVINCIMVLCVYFCLLTPKDINTIIPILFICYFILVLLYKNNNETRSILFSATILIFNLITLYVLWYFFSLFSVFLIEGLEFLAESFLYMSESNQPQSGSFNVGGGSSSGGGEGNEPPKPSKPNLTIKIGPQTDDEKDLQKKSFCLHKDLSDFVPKTQQEAESRNCDFAADMGRDGTFTQHSALSSVSDGALVCNDCNAIICKNCYVEGTPEDTP